MKLTPLSRASCTIRAVSSWPRLPMFILPPNCIVPRATSLTMSPVFPSFRYFILHPPCLAWRDRPAISRGTVWHSPDCHALDHRCAIAHVFPVQVHPPDLLA